jgi:hypothetical protein
MNGMKIDLRIIRTWTAKWEKGTSVNQTTSQLAAVMLSKALEQSEARSARVTGLMKGILAESAYLQKLGKVLVCCLMKKEPLESHKEMELKTHRRRMASMLKEVDQVLKEPEHSQSIMVGGLLLEINKDNGASEDSA